MTTITALVGPSTFQSPIVRAQQTEPAANLLKTPVNSSVSVIGTNSPLARDNELALSPATSVKTPNSSPPNRSPFLRAAHTSPLGQIVGGSTGKSPLRSCHMNSDATTHLRRLATATFVNSSPPNRSPTVVRGLSFFFISLMIVSS